MKNCPYCGAQLDDSAVFCSTCGANTSAAPTGSATTHAQYSSNIGWTILGFFIPIVALILYFVWKDTEPDKAIAVGKGGLMAVSFNSPIIGLILYFVFKDKYYDIAKACGICALISAILLAVFFVFYFVLIILIAASTASFSVLPLLLI